MYDSVRVFATEIIDYAGLFPPAKLGMAEAFERFEGHRASVDGWMLARFVCPGTRLGELRPLIDRSTTEDDGIRLSVLGRGGDTPAGLLAALEDDLAAIDELMSSVGDRVIVDLIELRLPGNASSRELAETVAKAAELITSKRARTIPFFESSLLSGWRELLPGAVEAVSGAHTENRPVGLKIRCGGSDAAAVPGSAAVTAAVASCRRASIPLKATQGLHHPLRHFDSELNTMAHGFINLFAAGMMARAFGFDEERLLEVVEEEDPSAFGFSERQLVWRDCRLDLDHMVDARRSAVTSFGSCSFAEPRDELRQLGLLDAVS